MRDVSRWTPEPAWLPLPAAREYRPGYRGHLWAILREDRARRLLPILGGPVPAPPPGMMPRWFAVRLDCTGRLDRVLGSSRSATGAGALCGDDTGLLGEFEVRDYERTGKRPPWTRVPPGTRMLTLDERTGMMGSEPVHPVVLRGARFTWRMRRLRDTWTRTRRARLPGDPDDPSTWPGLNQGTAYRAAV